MDHDLPSPADGSDPPAGRAGAPSVAPTGEPAVDAALERLDGLRTVPLADTPAGFDEVHQLLHLTLADDGR